MLCKGPNHFAAVCSRRKSAYVKHVDAVEEPSRDSCEDDVSFFELFNAQHSFQANSEANRQKIFRELIIENKKIKFQLDTGANCNILPYKYVQNNKVQKHNSRKLRLYDGTEMKTMGSCKLPCVIANRKTWIDFIILEDDRQPILGAPTCLEEGLIEIPVI